VWRLVVRPAAERRPRGPELSARRSVRGGVEDGAVVPRAVAPGLARRGCPPARRVDRSRRVRDAAIGSHAALLLQPVHEAALRVHEGSAIRVGPRRCEHARRAGEARQRRAAKRQCRHSCCCCCHRGSRRCCRWRQTRPSPAHGRSAVETKPWPHTGAFLISMPKAEITELSPPGGATSQDNPCARCYGSLTPSWVGGGEAPF
jgi:hypothetical protein